MYRLMHKNQLPSVFCRGLGCLFVVSALLKLHAFQTFQGEVRLYLEAYFPSAFVGHELGLAGAVCALELAIGLCAIAGVMRRRLSIAYVAVLSFFVWLTGINLFFPSLMDSIESCGCFGELIHFTPAASFAKSVSLWAVSFVWMGLEIRKDDRAGARS